MAYAEIARLPSSAQVLVTPEAATADEQPIRSAVDTIDCSGINNATGENTRDHYPAIVKLALLLGGAAAGWGGLIGGAVVLIRALGR